MSLHPILALDQVIDEYRDYLRTEFRARDRGLREALERALDQPLFLAQEAFYQAHRPFRLGRRWRDLPLDPKLARVMEDRARRHGSATPEFAFIHQSAAIEVLLAENSQPVVVTTGTGSGKTEAFLLPVIHNAVEDAARFRKNGLTAILVYPMNALANDQEQRIREYLAAAGFAGTVSVSRYDRSTKEAEREALRRDPPHILLTNYMMLEYLLVRPKDREDIFANHRCRYLVLDEVHTYRGALGSNIALLVRRLRAHLSRARQDWLPDVDEHLRRYRFPLLIPVGTSATIKSTFDASMSREEATRQRDLAVQQFFAKLAGVEANSIRVFGEELEEIRVPDDAGYSAEPIAVLSGDVTNFDTLRHALCRLSGAPEDTPLDEAARRSRLLWDLSRWLITKPMSVGELVENVQTEVTLRTDSSVEAIRAEIEAALVAGAALPDGTPGALRLRAHRFLRGGWRFHRCVNPDCGRLYPMGEERCTCGFLTAPLFLCRNCGADSLRFVGDAIPGQLTSSAVLTQTFEWMLYEPAKFDAVATSDDDDDDDDDGSAPPPTRRATPQQITQMKQRPVLQGSFEPRTLSFSANPGDYSLQVLLAPARNRCLCCGGSAGSRSVVTPVALGTSAAVKVVAEGLVEALAAAHRAEAAHDGKERLLIFSDSRQDAAHQARFIVFASRYDRMRRRLLQILQQERSLPIQRSIELLGERGVQERDNPFAPAQGDTWIPDEALNRMRGWEEAPLLDELAITAGYRGTLINLGLVGVRYHRLDEYVRARGDNLASALGLSPDQLEHVCRCILDDMRTRGCLSREMLRYHPLNPACPEYVRRAEWERRVKQPQGYPASPQGRPLAQSDGLTIPFGIKAHNAWRRPGVGGRGPRLQVMLTHLLSRMGGMTPTANEMVDVLQFLADGSFLTAVDLYGAQQRARLVQVNADVVRLDYLEDTTRMRCSVCGTTLAFANTGMPCPRCRGDGVAWPSGEVDQNRTVRRIRSDSVIPLVAGEHTAQVPNDDRIDLETRFKAAASVSKVNVLACSPTLEMGIDVGGLDAVVMRNVPPRPDNYAQRGGRAGRRSRVGLVLGYARSTPHDQYFYDRPAEMIAGEIPAPVLALGNRDVIARHLYAIAFGAADPGLSGRMADYVNPQGEVKQDIVNTLIAAVRAQFGYALELAHQAWGNDVLAESGLDDESLRTRLDALPDRLQDVIDRTARQVQELRQALDVYATELRGLHAGTRAGELVARILGIPTDRSRGRAEADDRSAGYPLRRLAEFGILPGYEFPTEPAALRLLGDNREEDPVTVGRRFGIGQYQPDAQVFARERRWKVIGLDNASPWNPRSDAASWSYRVCSQCELRYRADQPRCPRCSTDTPGRALPAYEFGGFLAKREENPVLDEEERFATRNLVDAHPQWDGDVIARWTAGPGWGVQLRTGEEVQWLNEGVPPTPTDLQNGVPILHAEAKGYLICPSCGRLLNAVAPQNPQRGRRRANTSGNAPDPYGHGENCPHRGRAPSALCIAATARTEVLRLLLPIPASVDQDDVESWGLSLGSALRIGMRHLYMLDGSEIEFELEGPWKVVEEGGELGRVAFTFIDPSLGGTGYLRRIGGDLHLVARRAIEHLDHTGCETACYRCLKSYQNQRYHDRLRWPLAMPFLEALADEAPTSVPLQTGDIADPRPWLEAYAAGVGSPLELRFFQLFEAHGFRAAKQVPVSANDGDAPISIADFAIPDRRLAIYIDGAAFHVGSNLRRDRYIRQRLRNGTPPWRVEELRVTDLVNGAALVDRLRS